MTEKSAFRSTTVKWVYLIVAIYITIIFGLIVFTRIELDVLSGIRAYIGGEGLWAKAQKSAQLSLRNYASSHDEADYQSFLSYIKVPLGDQKARLELQKPNPDLQIAREGFLQGGNHPADLEYAIPFFLRFQHNPYMAKVITHWTRTDPLIADLQRLGEELHEEIVSGQVRPDVLGHLEGKLKAIDRQATEENNLFTLTLGEAARWANNVTRKLLYSVAFVSLGLGIVLSLPIIHRIKTTENALSVSEERYRSIFEHAGDIIYIIESDTTLSSISPAFERMTGWTPAEWIGRPFPPIVHPDDLPYIQELFVKAMRGEDVPIFHVRILTKSGGYLETEIAATPLRNPGSISILGVVRDITERKRIEDEIRKLNVELEVKVEKRTRQLLEAQQELVHQEKLALLGQVAANMGNELRNPLGVMNNAVFFLQHLFIDADETTREYLKIIHDEIAGVEGIVTDFLDAANPKPPQFKKVEVMELVGQTVNQCAIPSSIAVKLDIPETLSSIRVDPQQMQRVLRNLISNSVAAMPEGGILEIHTEEKFSKLRISVRDTGSGIAPENLDKLFQPMFSTKSRGIGLGLVVVKNLTQANGGSIEVQSEPGKGTVFDIIFPIAGMGGTNG